MPEFKSNCLYDQHLTGDLKQKRDTEVSNMSKGLQVLIGDVTQRVDSAIANYATHTTTAKESVEQMKEYVIKAMVSAFCHQ